MSCGGVMEFLQCKMMSCGGVMEFLQKMGWREILWLVLVYAMSSLVILLLKRWNSSEKFPPGPFAWPLIGHLHLLQSLPHRKFRSLSQKYGPILGLRLGQRRAVVVGSRELAREVLMTNDKAFANRPPHDFVSLMLYGPANDVIFGPNAPAWRKQRKLGFLSLFTAKRLQELEHVRQEEIASLLLRLRHVASDPNPHPIDLGNTVAEMATNVLMRLLVSKPAMLIGHDSARDFIKKLEHEGSFPTFGDLIPSLSFLDILRKRCMRRIHDCADKTLSAFIAERKKSTSAYDDFLQALLSKEASYDPALLPQDTFTLDEIKGLILDTLAAGIHTTTLTVEWMMTELLRHPHCFQRLREEIDSHVAKEQQIVDADLPKLSYLKLVAKEIFRLHPPLPLLLPRISDAECVVGGYTLPANTYMFVNAWAIHRDETLWEHADEFRPERFEGKAADIDVRGQNFELLPFGSGRRVCLGMPMALAAVEGTLANLVHNFDWELPDGKPVTSISVAEHNGLAASRDTPLLLVPKPRK